MSIPTPAPVNMRPKLSPLEEGAPPRIVALDAYARRGEETDSYPVDRLASEGVVSWPVGFKPEITPAGWAMLDLFGSR